jgi:uncharacterized protein
MVTAAEAGRAREFEPGQSLGLIRLAGIERELSQLLGGKVDLNTPGFLSPSFRDQVLERQRTSMSRHSNAQGQMRG